MKNNTRVSRQTNMQYLSPMGLSSHQKKKDWEPHILSQHTVRSIILSKKKWEKITNKKKTQDLR